MRHRYLVAAGGILCLLLVSALAWAAPDARRGRERFVDAGCLGCHTVARRGGITGPVLTYAGRRLTAAQIARKIENPRAASPGTLMPSAQSLHLSDADVADIAAYLTGLK